MVDIDELKLRLRRACALSGWNLVQCALIEPQPAEADLPATALVQVAATHREGDHQKAIEAVSKELGAAIDETGWSVIDNDYPPEPVPCADSSHDRCASWSSALTLQLEAVGSN